MSLSDCTVMVVEDHEFQRRTMLQILANLGTGRLLEAADGETALMLLAADPRPDIVVCDLDMPGMDGVELLRHVAERSIDTAIVIASGLGDDVLRSAETTARAYGLQVLGAMAKPLTARRLLEIAGLHRPVPPGVRPSSNGRQTDAWTAALAAGAVAVALRPRVDLLSCRPAGLQAQATRPGVDGAAIGAAAELSATAPAEVAGAIADVVLDVVCSVLPDLEDAMPGLDATLLLPLSACSDLTLPDRFAVRTRLAGIDPSRLCIALPAEPAMPDAAAALDVLTRLRLRGFRLGLDGFAAGHATLGGQGGVPLSEVALVREAFAAIGDSRSRADALDIAIRALRAQGARVVASGCDSAAEHDLLAQAGCDRAEGRAVGGPMSAAELADWAAGVR